MMSAEEKAGGCYADYCSDVRGDAVVHLKYTSAIGNWSDRWKKGMLGIVDKDALIGICPPDVTSAGGQHCSPTCTTAQERPADLGRQNVGLANRHPDGCADSGASAANISD